jgi:DNA-binding NarL/FixJ family response regulator
VAELKARLPRLLVMMITVYEDGDQIFASLQAGASGYMLKRSTPDEIVEGIRQLHAGGGPMSPEVASKVIAFFRQKAAADKELEQLTPREMNILNELAEGFRYKEIAENLSISLDTVRKHIQHIYAKLHVQSRTEAVVKYMRSHGGSGSDART